MPAMIDDPTSPVIYRQSGEPPYPNSFSTLPADIFPKQITLRDRVTVATLIPFSSPSQVPFSLLSYLCDQINKEIEKGDTYPMIDPLPLETFGPYWFANFGAVVLLGDVSGVDQVQEMANKGADWEKECLGSFYVKPNYPGRSSHVCNGGFLVTGASRNRGVGRLMGEAYLEWAPKLGYTYSVFNLVYETNVASCRIWDALGFKRIGRVKGCGNLRSYPDQPVDAIIYGRDLGLEGEDYVSEERFEKIKFYLKHGKYPNGADRAEKSRLRSAATHYKLLPATETEPEKLMLKDKEVIADPQKQYELARQVHMQHHGGINKTTASIAEKYHWVRIKETVSQVIRNCPDCKDTTKTTSSRTDKRTNGSPSLSTPAPKEEKISLSSPEDVPMQTLQPTPMPSNMQQDTPMAEVQLISEATAASPSQLPISVTADEQIMSYSIPVDPRIVSNVNYTQHQASSTPAMTSMGLPTRNDPSGVVTESQDQDDYDFSRQLMSAGFDAPI